MAEEDKDLDLNSGESRYESENALKHIGWYGVAAFSVVLVIVSFSVGWVDMKSDIRALRSDLDYTKRMLEEEQERNRDLATKTHVNEAQGNYSEKRLDMLQKNLWEKACSGP